MNLLEKYGVEDFEKWLANAEAWRVVTKDLIQETRIVPEGVELDVTMFAMMLIRYQDMAVEIVALRKELNTRESRQLGLPKFGDEN